MPAFAGSSITVTAGLMSGSRSMGDDVATAQTQSPWVVEVDRAVQRYFDDKLGRDRVVLNALRFQMREGEFCSLVGPSGCGKSTFFRLILGSEAPKGGSVRIFGNEAEEPNRDRGIVYQRYSLFPNMRVIDNVVFGLELEQVDFLMKWLWYPGFLGQRRAFVRQGLEYLEKVGLAEHAYKFPHQLSGGQQQRVAIAQALIMKPRVLLMDEPFGALDPGTRTELQNWLLDIHAEKKTSVFFITHDLEEAVYLATRVMLLSQHYTLNGETSEGSKIVADIAVAKTSDREHWHTDASLQETVDTVLHTGFREGEPIPDSDFILTHPDALPTA
jgi:NitT/TauT family transport system ATP-binding protein